jgi:hypothetical protein
MFAKQLEHMFQRHNNQTVKFKIIQQLLEPAITLSFNLMYTHCSFLLSLIEFTQEAEIIFANL